MMEAREGGEMKGDKFNVFYWGPLLFKTKIIDKDIKNLKKLGKQATESFTHGLAGIIDDELKIDSAKFTEIVGPYLKAYQQAYRMWYNLDLKQIETKSAWVNYMKKGECNPPHIHHNCHLSSVIILDIPEKLKKEQKAWKNTGQGPGALSFFTGNPQNFHTNFFEFKPEVGDFFIFPWNLTHTVSSFKSDIVRISIAANFLILDNNVHERNISPTPPKEELTGKIIKKI